MRHMVKSEKKLVDHLFRHNTFIRNIFEGKILGKRTRRRPRTPYFQDRKRLMEVTSYSQSKEMTNDRGNFLKEVFHKAQPLIDDDGI